MRSSPFPSTLSYGTSLKDRTHTFKTSFRSNNTNNIGSYSLSGSEASLKFLTSFGLQSRQNSSRSIFRQRSRCICATVSRLTEFGWWTNPTSIRTFILLRQGWRSNIFASCFSTFTKPYLTSRSCRYSTRTISGYSFISETLRQSGYTLTGSEILNFGSNLRKGQL